MPKRFDLIVFDWDGTLMDSTSTIALSIQLACKDLGLPIPTDEDAQHVIGLGLTDALAYAVPTLLPQDLPRMVERYRHHYLARDGELILFTGIIELLRALKRRGYRLAVATGKSRVGLERALDQTQTAPYFDATRTADEARPKPDPAMLVDILSLLEISPARALMVGDTTHDLQMAARAGAAGLGVSYGAHPAPALWAEAPLTVVSSVGKLSEWLVLNA